MRATPVRVLAGIIGLAAVFALIVKAFVFIELTRTLSGGGALAGLWVTLSFFTILTHIAGVAVFGQIAAGRWPHRWPGQAATLGALTLYLGLIALVYHLALRHLWNPQGLHYVADVLLHGAIPAGIALFWWLHAPKSGLRAVHALWWLVWPLAYFAYVMARGALDGFYPYPFLHVGQLGLAQVMLNGLGLGAAFYASGWLVVLLAQWRAQKSPP